MFFSSRRTSRRNKRRTSRKKKRRTSKVPFPPGLVARKGLLTYKDLRAREYKGGDQIFRGRIQVDRGTGVLEFPKPSQFGRIAREEGISNAAVTKAFGHMRGLRKNAGKLTSKRARRGRLSHGGDAWVMQELPASIDLQAAGLPADKRIWVTTGGTWSTGGEVKQVLDHGEAMKVARAEGFTAADVKRAFGHLSGKVAAPGGRPETGPDYFGPKRMTLGHLDAKGDFRGGVKRGSLVLKDKRTGGLPWLAQVIPTGDRKKTTGGTVKPILVRYGGKSYDLTWMQAFSGAGSRGAERKALSATERNIPPVAFLNAFAFLLPKSVARKLYHEYGGRAPGGQ
jgi:hypothetical protein